jgi:hypothetical protein
MGIGSCTGIMKALGEGTLATRTVAFKLTVGSTQTGTFQAIVGN